MKPHTLKTILLALLLLTLATTSSLAQKPTLVFVVSRPDLQESTSFVDAVLMVDSGKLRAPYPEENKAAQQKFARDYFAPGKRYRLTFGGGEVGTATIKSHQVGCNNIHASAIVQDNGKIPTHLSGLATNSASLGKKPVSRRAPSAEREAVMKLVHQIYRARQTTPALLRTLKTTNLTATDLDGDGKLELIGSFVIETGAKARRDLLLIAEPQGDVRARQPSEVARQPAEVERQPAEITRQPGSESALSYKAAFVNFQAYKLPDEGFDSAINFVDQLDIDGDGIGEVFTEQHGFDAYGYIIYKKVNGRWREVLRTIGDAC